MNAPDKTEEQKTIKKTEEQKNLKKKLPEIMAMLVLSAALLSKCICPGTYKK